jgi:hypothetical protein
MLLAQNRCGCGAPTRATGRWQEAQAAIHSQSPPGSYTAAVPTISVFFGIVVRMFYKEHEPSHFHAEYQG